MIDKDGHILTNYHVIENARQVEVTMHNRKKYKATVVGTDPPHDLAVIQIQGAGSGSGGAGRFAQSAGRDRKCMPSAIRSDWRERMTLGES